jgi:hypothetical protein
MAATNAYKSREYGGKIGGSYVFSTYYPDAFTNYTNQYSDIQNAYNSWLYDSRNVHWADYVRLNSNLEQYWQKNKDGYLKDLFGGKAPNRWDFGAYHYNTYGRNESRTLPKVVDVPASSKRNEMVTIIVRQNNGRIMDDNSAKASFGNFHFNRPEVQAYEDRIAPGFGPKLSLDGRGNLKVNAGISTSKAEGYINSIKNYAQSVGPGQYKQLASYAINILGGKNNILFKEFSQTAGVGIDALNAYYQANKINIWDPVKQGAQPPVGGFDPAFYRKQASSAVNLWNNNQLISVGGILLPNLDLTATYGNLNNYLNYHYTTQGKAQGLRGNEAQDPSFADNYTEQLTDSELQIYRDEVLGLTGPGGKTINWEDKNVGLLEAEALKALEARDAQEQQVFGALTQDALKQTSQKLLEQKRKESNLSLFRGLPGYDEILSVNETLANSLLGDTGVGGILSITQDPEKTQESLEKQISQFTGVSSNSTLYNWQNWFDTELIKRYEEMTEIMSPEDAAQMLEVEQGFAQTFIDDYLKPRFDQSKSMDEFISYMDVKDEEQNIFQTQSAVNALKDVANVRAKLFYDQIKKAKGGEFDSDFYFNPTVYRNKAKTDLYQKQKNEVAKDWQDAKNRGDQVKVGQYTWNQWAYYYGLNPKNKNDFARLHYQVKGMGEGFDPAKDIVTIDDAKAYINNVVVPAIEQADLEIGDQPFLQFTTPEQFAEELLEGISPEENKEEWNKILEIYGLDPLSASLEEVKDYIIEAVRTNQAQDIRESIKYLNEKKLKPTQKRLGVTYIERAEDDKTIDNPEETALYTIFKNSGYAGSEDQFYDEFMSDTSKSEQQLLAKAMSGDLSLTEIGTDPFEALSDVSSFFGTEEDIFGSPLDKPKEEDEPTTSSYFRLFEDDEAEPTKSNAAESYISEFTSLFKGFK